MGRDDYLHDRLIPVSRHLATVLDITNRADHSGATSVCEALAEQLNVRDLDRLGPEADAVLVALVPPIEEVLATATGNWLTDWEQNPQRSIAQRAVKSIGLPDLIEAMAQFGMDEIRPAVKIASVRGFDRAPRQALADWLKPRLFRMLQRWEKAGAWEETTRRGIFPAARRRPA